MLRNTLRFGFLCMALPLSLLFVGCPTQASYQTTITPIYAATNSGLFVFNGTSWTNYTTANGLASNAVTSVVVSGSGSGATVFAGTSSAGISYSHGSAWTTWTQATNGLGSNTINRLFLGSNLFAATSGGLSTYNFGGTWTNAATPASVNDVSFYGTFTYVAANAGLYVFNGTSQVLASPYAPSSIIASSTKVNAVLVDSAQDIIAGTDKGLAILYYGSPSFTTLGLPANTNVHGLFLDSTGTLYAASDSGLFILGTGTYPALPATAVFCVYVDGAGTIYAGTSTGLKISNDGGTSWTTSLAGQTVNCVVATAPLYSF